MLYFDESGYTGPDLTNIEQPYFTLASIKMNDDEITHMKKDIGYDKWGKELHFKNMYTNPQGRTMLGKIFNHPMMNENHVLPSFANKRYCIYAHVVNMLVETMYYNNSLNLYEGAKNLILANGLYYSAVLHPNKDLVAEFENNFVGMVRSLRDVLVLGVGIVIFLAMQEHDHVRILLDSAPSSWPCIRQWQQQGHHTPPCRSQ